MDTGEIDILEITRGAIVAPAGCGKTHLIAAALTRYKGRKPVLVLTHTNAGVAALRGRLASAGVARSAYRLATIDGWAMRLISTFPVRSGHDTSILELANPATNYRDIRLAAAELLASGDISDIVEANYEHVVVDEYQDCSVLQHGIVVETAQVLPTCVLGDTMQAIFGFGDDPLADWSQDVSTSFPIVGELDTPWRWINAEAQPLGEWLLNTRAKLLRGQGIDLGDAPDAVRWVELDGDNDHALRLRAARVRSPRRGGRCLIIGESTSPDSQRLFASRTPGAVVVEAVDLRDFVNFARTFDINAPNALRRLLVFAQGLMTNVGASELIRRVGALERGTARNAPTEIERMLLAFLQAPSNRHAADVLMALSQGRGVRKYRPGVFAALVNSFELSDAPNGPSLYDAAKSIREQYRLLGRPLPNRAVGSTLLLKGLESDVSVILDAESHDARNLYVAMTRGSRILVVCSRNRIVSPY